MTREVVPSEFKLVLSVVNDAAEAYKGVIPVDRWKEPHLTSEEFGKKWSTVWIFMAILKMTGLGGYGYSACE